MSWNGPGPADSGSRSCDPVLACATPARPALDLRAAVLELERLYRLELASLARRAARMARAREARRASPARSPRRGSSTRALARERAWRHLAQDALACALHDGIEPSAALRLCLARPLERWPAAERLRVEARDAALEPQS